MTKGKVMAGAWSYITGSRAKPPERHKFIVPNDPLKVWRVKITPALFARARLEAILEKDRAMKEVVGGF